MTARPRLRIDFVSDIACPWCAIGLAGLERALENLRDELEADIYLQPFELNPDTPPEGVDADEHLKAKYSMGEARLAATRARLRERAAAVGFAYNVGPGSRVWNTFAAHRLLHWATLQDPHAALALKRALFRAFFSDNENVSDPAVLVRCAEQAGLDTIAARAALVAGDYADEVRGQERHYQRAGIHSVPATLVNRTFLISGGQPPDVFESALRKIASEAAWDEAGGKQPE
ncbi:MAG: DsbA family oxidoreductase [Nevskiaceae bacterium]|nr:MAG: DsbA family oxidoreductase [Nevskiaceae bacterium]TBR73525.1 MAG: DsbA family oxidoreductase [Nevskiaceae bacterium]